MKTTKVAPLTYEVPTEQGTFRVGKRRLAPHYSPLWRIAPPGVEWRFNEGYDTRAEALAVIAEELKEA